MLDSLKRRIVLLCVLALGVIWLGTLAVSYQDASAEMRQLLDAHLAQAVSLLTVQSGVELDEVDTDHAPELHKYARSVSFQIWRHGETLGVHSANAPDEQLGTPAEGFSERNIGGVRWRVFSAWDREHENLIQVGEQIATRDHLLREMIEHLLKPMLIALPLLALLLWLAVRLGLRPLDHVTADIARRDPQQLDAVELHGAPTEVRPLLSQLNLLFARIAESLANTQRFTADAAHELRTPLAAIRAQAQVASLSTDTNQQQHALRQVVQGSDQATRLIEQLLTLARLDADATPVLEETAIRALLAESIADIAATAIAKDGEIALEDGEEFTLCVQPGLIRILLRNLLDNAIRYSPPGSEISVCVHAEDMQLLIDVCDSGPGIPPDQRERVFDRFHRVLGSGQSGSGLGLSIAQSIAQLHGGQISLHAGPQGRGLLVRTHLPRRPRTAERRASSS
ncbi:ATP-binding protein [Uliginosibacterium sediminicola]|uniref:histidine kinase n=1 Tax=Uliginosibacterium sediminicola TaxID=2024550 RepID=A0ABU9YUD6_9RHOO